MKIVHLADTHLGYRMFSKLNSERGLNQRECDVYDRWHEAVDTAVALEPDLVVHAGDLFDSSRPAPRAVAEALDGFKKLRDADIPVVVIAGNHETPRFRSGGSVFEILERFGVEAVWAEPRTIRFNGIAIHAVPHEPSAERLAEDVRSLPLDAKADANVLVLHTGLNELPRQGYNEVNEIELDPEVLTEIEYDYIALGHLHRYQAAQVNALYPGSLERLDFGDIEGDKALLEIDLATGAGRDGFVVRHPLSARPVLSFPFDCEGLGPAEVLKQVEKAVSGATLTDAVVRVRLDRIARDAYQALNFGALKMLFDECLHHVVHVGHGGLTLDGSDGGSEISFEEFARDRVPKGLDTEAVVALARRYIDDASAAEAEAEAEAG